MSDDEISMAVIFLAAFSFIGVIGAFQSHAFGPFTSIVVGAVFGAVMTVAAAVMIYLAQKWWFWVGCAVVVVIGFAHELFRAW